MRKNSQKEVNMLHRLFRPMQALIWVEITLALLLVLSISGVFHAGSSASGLLFLLLPKERRKV